MRDSSKLQVKRPGNTDIKYTIKDRNLHELQNIHSIGEKDKMLLQGHICLFSENKKSMNTSPILY